VFPIFTLFIKTAEYSSICLWITECRFLVC